MGTSNYACEYIFGRFENSKTIFRIEPFEPSETRTDDTGAKHTFSFYENRCKWVDRRLSIFFQHIVCKPFDEWQWRKYDMRDDSTRQTALDTHCENTAKKGMNCLQVRLCVFLCNMRKRKIVHKFINHKWKCADKQANEMKLSIEISTLPL